jgi:hypothetical protein
MIRTIPLPWPTSRTSIGPQIAVENGSVLLRYDSTSDDTVEWIEVRFTDVLLATMTTAAACAGSDVVGFDYISVEEDTPLTKEYEKRWNTSVGWHETRHEPLKEYRMYFDDVMAVLVLARNVSVQE